MDGDQRLWLQIAVMVGGFVAMVWVMRSQLGEIAKRMGSMEAEVKPISAQLAALAKDNEHAARDMTKLEARMGTINEELASLRAGLSRLDKSVGRCQATCGVSDRGGSSPDHRG